MCRVTRNPAPARKPLRLLLSLDSFSSEKGGGPPSATSCLVSGFLVIAALVLLEVIFRQVFLSLKDAHPLLENETNRQILARHIGVDATSLIICASLGLSSSHMVRNMIQSGFSGQSETINSMVPKSGSESRLFSYNPDGFRLCLFFFFYQVKNTYDTVVWDDGWVFIFHHIFSLITAWGAMTPGVGQLYAMFFFGLSEISTAAVCLLANFDDEQGVPGLGDAFPVTKVGIGTIFIVLFITCRCILWPLFAFFFIRDVRVALKGDDPRAKERRRWLYFFLTSLTSLTVLQIAWLGEIFVVAHKEFTKIGLL